MIELDFAAAAVVIGTLLPLLISLLKGVPRTWPKQLVKTFAFAFALVAAIIQTGADLGWQSLNFSDVLMSFGIIYTLAQTTYVGLWRGTSIEAGLALTSDREGESFDLPE